MTLESRPFSSSQTGEKRERNRKIFTSNSQNSICWSWAKIQRGEGKVGFTGPDDDTQKCDPIAESVDTLLQRSKMVFYAAATADCSFLTVPSRYA